MKGIIPVIVIVAIILGTVLGGEAVGLSIFVNRFETVRREILEIDVIQGINVLENLRTELVRSLNYSFYQGMYEVAAKGGYQNFNTVKSLDCKPYWMIYSEKYFPDKSLENIQLQTQIDLNIFGDKLQVENTNIPDYTVFINKTSNSLVDIFASISSPLTASGNNFVVSDNSNFNKTFNIDVSKIYTTSKTEFIDNDPIGNAISNVNANQMPDTCKKHDADYCEGSVPTCEDALVNQNNCKNADTVFKDKVTSVVSNIGTDLSRKYSAEKIGYAVQIKNMITGHDTTDETKESCSGSSDCGCGCKVRDSNNKCTTYYKKFNVKCTYNYKGAVFSAVTATDLSNTYPVYDGTTAFRNIKLQFLVVSSSDQTNYKPLQVQTSSCVS